MGIDNYTDINWTKFSNKIIACNLKGFFSKSVSENILCSLLSTYNNFVKLVLAQQNKYWIHDEIRKHKQSLHHKKIALLGYGSIVQEFEKLVTPFNCSFKIFNRTTYHQQSYTFQLFL